ncbi:MAG: GH1 family beta-glucosidase [Thermomicrobiales bacterium]|nr:GH1 family beta-glucosidase [Thermomicrobiales bacterium]
MAGEVFPDDFVWGAATASYQIEGAVREDGRGSSIWDVFSHTPGKVANGDTGDFACDHYHRWRDDVGLMRDIALPNYRFSLSWPRILPLGTGRIEQKGLDFYDRLIEELLENGIEPWVTLHHWDLPSALYDQGGWVNRDTCAAFVEFTDIVTRRYGDRVKHWITLNEPWCSAFLGYVHGIHAPGHTNLKEGLQVMHHLLLAHGLAMPVIRANVPDADAGICLNPTTFYPYGDSQEDLDAAIREDGLRNRVWLDPLAARGYPDDMVDLFREIWPEVGPDDLEIIATPSDFIGVNFYNPTYVEAGNEPPLFSRKIDPPNLPRTDMGWIVEPSALTDLVTRIHTDYGEIWTKQYIFENGAAYDDRLVHGKVDDRQRARYIHDHLAALYKAIDDGVPVKGYFVWSLMDNFEWAEGYARRFGLIYVDYKTQQRTIKRSGRWYAEVVSGNELIAPD